MKIVSVNMCCFPIKRFHFFPELVKYDTLNIGFTVIESGGVVGCFFSDQVVGCYVINVQIL